MSDSKPIRTPPGTPGKTITILLWIGSLTYMVVVFSFGLSLFRPGNGVVVGGVLMLFSPLPVVMLIFRNRPDVERRRLRHEQQKAELAQRLEQRREDERRAGS